MSAIASRMARVVARPGSRIRSGHAMTRAAKPTAPESGVWALRPSNRRSAVPNTSDARRIATADA